MVLDINQIHKMLPHRPPFLLVDRILELEPRKRIVGLKNVTMNEPFFVGHFPSYPVMPGVLTVEAMAQTGGILLMHEFPDHEKKMILFAAIEEAKFRRPIVPGDQIRLEVEVLSWRTTIGRMKGKALVDGQLCAEAIMMCKIVDKAQ